MNWLLNYFNKPTQMHKDADMYLNKKKLNMSIDDYNKMIDKINNGVNLFTSETDKMAIFRTNYYSNYNIIGLNIYSNDNIVQDSSKTKIITVEEYNNRFEKVQKGYILSRTEQNEMYKLFIITYNKNNNKYKGAIMQIVVFVPECFTDIEIIEDHNSFICWACGKKHMDSKIIDDKDDKN